jgi:hypothetical protein
MQFEYEEKPIIESSRVIGKAKDGDGYYVYEIRKSIKRNLKGLLGGRITYINVYTSNQEEVPIINRDRLIYSYAWGGWYKPTTKSSEAVLNNLIQKFN